MTLDRLTAAKKAALYLRKLCHEIPGRRLGTGGNRQATNFFAEVLGELGFNVSHQRFPVLDWVDGGASLAIGKVQIEVFSSPYTLGCEIEAPLVMADSVEDLQGLDAAGCILLLHGRITAEQLMPKQFPFYNPEHHQKIYQLLEEKAPAAIITATSRNPELAGAMYPFPMIEDGDFDIPSVYMKDRDVLKLQVSEGETVSLSIRTERIPSEGENVIAHIGPAVEDRIVLCAHIDAKEGTPGALDNGTGVVMLLILAEGLKDYAGKYLLEIVAFNGEDHYSAAGHKEYIRQNQGRFEEIVLAINTDVAGYVHGPSAFSFYGIPHESEEMIREVISGYEGLVAGESWYQSDHSIFVQQGCPAMAITSDRFEELSRTITHTPKDEIDLVDFNKLVEIYAALADVITALNLGGINSSEPGGR